MFLLGVRHFTQAISIKYYISWGIIFGLIYFYTFDVFIYIFFISREYSAFIYIIITYIIYVAFTYLPVKFLQPLMKNGFFFFLSFLS